MEGGRERERGKQANSPLEDNVQAEAVKRSSSLEMAPWRLFHLPPASSGLEENTRVGSSDSVSAVDESRFWGRDLRLVVFPLGQVSAI